MVLEAAVTVFVSSASISVYCVIEAKVVSHNDKQFNASLVSEFVA